MEHFKEVLASCGFILTEEDGALVVTRESDGFIWPYKPRPDGRVPPKTYQRFAYKFGIDIKKFVPPNFVR